MCVRFMCCLIEKLFVHVGILAGRSCSKVVHVDIKDCFKNQSVKCEYNK
jgi:hypothetical protein